MRRFEFIEGTSSKFWEADVSGTSFVVAYGRVGTAGQRKEKAFASADLAQREMDRKVAEKLREGYIELTGAATAPKPAAKPALPPRFRPVKPTPAALAEAAAALATLEAELGGRSWRVDRAARAAARALDRVAGVDPRDHAPLAPTFDALMASVTAPRGARRLPLRLALVLLARCHADAWQRAVDGWRAAPDDAPAAPAARALAHLRDALDDRELSLRAGALLGDRPDAGGGPEAAWAKRWSAIHTAVEQRAAERGGGLKALLAAAATAGDPHLARRVARMSA
ncbi:MAG: WGR domain-containing protein [Polyangiales bacterium]